jgi:two pore calcium channel protein 1
MVVGFAVVYDTFSNLEKKKVKKLFFHKRLGCQHAFRLLVTKEVYITVYKC